MFVVEVTHPSHATDQDDVRVECDSLDKLAVEIDEAIGCGTWTALEIATDVARGEGFEDEDTETGRIVSVRRVSVHAPEEVAELGFKRRVCTACGIDWPCPGSVKETCSRRRADGQVWCDCGWHKNSEAALVGGRS